MNQLFGVIQKLLIGVIAEVIRSNVALKILINFITVSVVIFEFWGTLGQDWAVQRVPIRKIGILYMFIWNSDN